ncbi:type I methionyl aminopeptidase [Ruminiclostridium cellobioparum]|uniref:Methionine aminopeptidase n=1 Tax=Ruminiclostridium cellobioparum subsp. termitidis CT1112 TaxID=1195236 RepID=S0FHU6_RUMCE|nr:type I methionyl aminopeptidase [Ruminiclostridium cellobioparum]EMS71340.1 methionine aminopeptidase, type I [Ruminiclostridium cellobioparum subsp. termitidis CT1112]
MFTIKSQAEIDKMRKAGEVLYETLQLLKKNIAPGVTTKELDRIAFENIRKYSAIPSFKGYEPGIPGVVPFPASICTSVNEEVVHGIPSSLNRLKDGDIISIDVGVYLNGYHADAARTYGVGKISGEAQRLITETRQSFFEGLKQMEVGKHIRDISEAIQSHAESKGFSVVRDFVGHGIGRELHELPEIPNYVTKRRGAKLESGMTIAVEPMINEGTYSVRVLDNSWTVVTSDGSLSAHYENTVAITENGPLILTKF